MFGVITMDIILLSTEKDLRIFMLPLRQKIIRYMRIAGKPVTPKQIADELAITPSSAQHHIKKLKEIGIVEFDHNETINGIVANYMRLTSKTISIGQDANDELSYQRDTLSKNRIFNVYKGFQESLEKVRSNKTKEKISDMKLGDMLSGVVHLSEEKSEELFKLINKFISENEVANENTHPWEYAMITYRTDLTPLPEEENNK